MAPQEERMNVASADLENLSSDAEAAVEHDEIDTIPPSVLAYAMMFSTQRDQLRLSSVSRLLHAGYKDFRNSINYFSLLDLAAELDPVGGQYYASESWCLLLMRVLLETRIGNIRGMDFSPMRAKVIETLYDYIKDNSEKPDVNGNFAPKLPADAIDAFSNVTHFALPEGIVDWADINRLADLCPRLERLVISSLNVEYLFKTEPRHVARIHIDVATSDLAPEPCPMASFDILLTAILGCTISSATIPVILVIYFARHLRSSIELVLVGGLLVADAVLAVANAGSGIERMVSTRPENATLPVSVCYFSPYVFMFAFCYQTIGLMTLAVSLERFVAVFFPLLYVRYGRYQGYLIVTAVFSFGTGTYVAAIPLHLHVQDPVSAFCFATTTLNPALMKSLRLLRFATVTLSIILYIPVVWKVYQILSDKSMNVGSHRQMARLSITIGLTSLAALLFVLIPDAIIVFDLFGLRQSFHVFTYSINLFKGVFNLLVYTTKHRALRDTLRRTICCWKQNRLGSWVS
ncbi:hypothetical protein QR680_018168 [Steinernema hermaphroditum]|uniref:G-protein coupled receptors family 1 profile domain-containing protein n=1 Tax=Steinernema hermaphroditum TaxID=289476 RepID=A0AA39LPX7_9BILA|nr:hypothetical protein QR680_018168 [Steinernema hermaphroditum]